MVRIGGLDLGKILGSQYSPVMVLFQQTYHYSLQCLWKYTMLQVIHFHLSMLKHYIKHIKCFVELLNVVVTVHIMVNSRCIFCSMWACLYMAYGKAAMFLP